MGPHLPTGYTGRAWHEASHFTREGKGYQNRIWTQCFVWRQEKGQEQRQWTEISMYAESSDTSTASKAHCGEEEETQWARDRQVWNMECSNASKFR